MKIVIVSDWYSESMGYAENFLPKAFGKLGHEVHVLTSNLQVYATSPDYDKVYKEKLGDAKTDTGVFKNEYFILHRNSCNTTRFGINILGVEEKLVLIKPDIVYCFEVKQRTTFLMASLKDKYKYSLFCESRMHSSVFFPPNTLTTKMSFWLNNKLFGLAKVVNKIDKFYPIGPDVYINITQYYKVPPSKCELSSLAVETDIFTPVKSDAHVNKLRNKFGFSGEDIVCVYTGRLTPEKGPIILAKAIEYLQDRGYLNVKGLFVGQGDDIYKNTILKCKGCVVIPFVNPLDLPSIYHSADIGVWPLQESTSQLDAMACGIPIIVNDTISDTRRFEGNGLTFKQNDFKDLGDKILVLSDKTLRLRMGEIGSKRIFSHYSWDALAKKKLNSFELMVNGENHCFSIH